MDVLPETQMNPEMIKRQKNWLKGEAEWSDSVHSLTHIVEDESVRRERGSSTPNGSQALVKKNKNSLKCLILMCDMHV